MTVSRLCSLSLTCGENFPKPFNPETVIWYDLPHAGFVSLDVYNILGQKIATLVDEHQVAGSYSVRFNPSGLASGLYFYRLQARQTNGGQADNFVQTRKMVLMK